MNNNQKRKRPTVAEKRLKMIYKNSEIILKNDEHLEQTPSAFTTTHEGVKYFGMRLSISMGTYSILVRNDFVGSLLESNRIDALVQPGHVRLSSKDLKIIEHAVNRALENLVIKIDNQREAYARKVARAQIMAELQQGRKFNVLTGKLIVGEPWPVFAK